MAIKDDTKFGDRIKAVEYICVFHSDTKEWKTTSVSTNETELVANSKGHCAFFLAKRHSIEQAQFHFMPLIAQPESSLHLDVNMARRAIPYSDE